MLAGNSINVPEHVAMFRYSKELEQNRNKLRKEIDDEKAVREIEGLEIHPKKTLCKRYLDLEDKNTTQKGAIDHYTKVLKLNPKFQKKTKNMCALYHCKPCRAVMIQETQDQHNAQSEREALTWMYRNRDKVAWNQAADSWVFGVPQIKEWNAIRGLSKKSNKGRSHENNLFHKHAVKKLRNDALRIHTEKPFLTSPKRIHASPELSEKSKYKKKRVSVACNLEDLKHDKAKIQIQLQHVYIAITNNRPLSSVSQTLQLFRQNCDVFKQVYGMEMMFVITERDCFVKEGGGKTDGKQFQLLIDSIYNYVLKSSAFAAMKESEMKSLMFDGSCINSIENLCVLIRYVPKGASTIQEIFLEIREIEGSCTGEKIEETILECLK